MISDSTITKLLWGVWSIHHKAISITTCFFFHIWTNIIVFIFISMNLTWTFNLFLHIVCTAFNDKILVATFGLPRICKHIWTPTLMFISSSTRKASCTYALIIDYCLRFYSCSIYLNLRIIIGSIILYCLISICCLILCNIICFILCTGAIFGFICIFLCCILGDVSSIIWSLVLRSLILTTNRVISFILIINFYFCFISLGFTWISIICFIRGTILCIVSWNCGVSWVRSICWLCGVSLILGCRWIVLSYFGTILLLSNISCIIFNNYMCSISLILSCILLHWCGPICGSSIILCWIFCLVALRWWIIWIDHSYICLICILNFCFHICIAFFSIIPIL